MSPSQLRARYWRIVRFFGGVTLSFIFWEIAMPRLGLRALTNRTRSERSRRAAVRFRALAIRMGGLMIKVGQFLSARLDVLPAEITQELSGLQDEVPPEEFEAIRSAAEADLGQPLSERYAFFDAEPLAAASLGQAHRARLCAHDAEEVGFEDVVVKVQRPHIEQIVDVDLSALRRVAGWLNRYQPIAKRTDVRALVEEFAATTLQEIDYLAEGRNAETFAENFSANPRVHVPRVVWAVTSRRVLTLEDVSAIKISDYGAITAAGFDRAEVAKLLLDTYMQQILEDGFFHADPHPGNLFVTPLEDGNWELTFVDFGMVGRVPDNLRAGLRELLIAIGTQDAKRLIESYKTLGVLLPRADLKLIELASMEVFDRFWGMSMADLKQLDHAELLRFGVQFRELMMDLPFQLPENLLLLGRTVAILSGMCTGLDPEFNLWTSIAPHANKLIAEEGAGPLQTILAEGQKLAQLLIALPSRVDRVLTITERGELQTRNPALERQTRRVVLAVNRLSAIVVFAALLLAGATLYASDPSVARWLMGTSVLPLAWALMGGRAGHGR
jgi:predicted unusual protein kinase regulating ubiquinone biosynthesis (AarF/ABC1/UbiB family)